MATTGQFCRRFSRPMTMLSQPRLGPHLPTTRQTVFCEWGTSPPSLAFTWPKFAAPRPLHLASASSVYPPHPPLHQCLGAPSQKKTQNFRKLPWVLCLTLVLGTEGLVPRRCRHGDVFFALLSLNNGHPPTSMRKGPVNRATHQPSASAAALICSPYRMLKPPSPAHMLFAATTGGLGLLFGCSRAIRS
ncbi:hypothetical protein QBC34DRAFT_407061 [Podospora aff. communis PSN243]|uniref:Uncharacterized protein n=1 Tax=Podospora aff. communis PSN243 TaxID=3040156 RepID=A0AAV9GLK8_9PEZI|nr:hypothetical protein QBC34DRAFT_407061 [Podospora aff. communis PSN243]